MAEETNTTGLSRRNLLRAAGVGVVGVTALSETSRATQQASVTFNNQTVADQTVVIAEVDISKEVRYALRTANHQTTFTTGTLSTDQALQDVQIQLDQPLERSQELDFSIYSMEGGNRLAHDTAIVSVEGGAEYREGVSVTRVDADPDAGFHYPYFLFAPSVPESETGKPILVEPNNTGTATDDFERHEQQARTLIERGLSRRVSEKLGAPLLVPVFPRPESDPVDWRHYVHQLDRQTLQINSGPLERVDRQLLRMVEDAQERLSSQSYLVDDQLMLNGFSASGNFVDRFTMLHPDRVVSVTAGGLNGMALLPRTEAKGHTLNYHIGIADVEEITGNPVDLAAVSEVNQFLYMGAEDSNDTIPYDDAWSDEMRQVALDVYGEDMIADRFPYCQTAYEEAGVDAQFHVYEGAGHTPRPATADIVEFHRRSINGEDVSGFGEQLGLSPSFTNTPQFPAPGDQIEFDAAPTELGQGDLLAYTWEFAGTETAAGQVVTHSFDTAGTYDITLRAIDSQGRSASKTRSITVGNQSNGSDGTTTTGSSSADESEEKTTSAPDGASNKSSTQSSSERGMGANTSTPASDSGSSNGSSPGFGIISTLTSVGGVAYLLGRRDDDGDTN